MTEPASVFREENRVEIRGTNDRSKFPSGYSAVVGRKMARALSLGQWAVLAFEHPALEREDLDGLNFRTPYTAIHCRVVIDPRLDENGQDCIEVDQTLRNALGIPLRVFRDLGSMPTFLLPASRPLWGRLSLSLARLFGIRFVAVRCRSASVPDIEKGYVRAPLDACRALAAYDFDKVTLERPFAIRSESGEINSFRILTTTTSLFPASDEFLREREDLSREFPARYPDVRRRLYDYRQFIRSGFLSEKAAQSADSKLAEPDLPPIFMDLDVRRFGTGDYPDQTADHATAFIARRSILSALARDSTQTGVIFSLAVVQFMLVFDFQPKGVTGLEIAFSLICGLIAALVFTVFRLRQQI